MNFSLKLCPPEIMNINFFTLTTSGVQISLELSAREGYFVIFTLCEPPFPSKKWVNKAGKIRRMKASAAGQNKFVVHILKLKCFVPTWCCCGCSRCWSCVSSAASASGKYSNWGDVTGFLFMSNTAATSISRLKIGQPNTGTFLLQLNLEMLSHVNRYTSMIQQNLVACWCPQK